MTGGGIDRRGPKDSENAHNSFLTKCTEKGFWIFATDMKLFEINMEGDYTLKTNSSFGPMAIVSSFFSGYCSGYFGITSPLILTSLSPWLMTNQIFPSSLRKNVLCLWSTIHKLTKLLPESLDLYLANIYIVCINLLKSCTYIHIFVLDSLDDDMFPRDDVVVNF